MKPLSVGRTLSVGLALAISACRASNPPKIDVCIGDGFGGADCVLKSGERLYLSPSQLENHWITNQEDMAAFSSWCYDADPSAIKAEMTRIKALSIK